jgi:c-di-GMP-binding flagellar brake protein YcgR
VNTDKTAADRRTSDRFAIEREVKYKVLNKKNAEESGVGRTVNMSSTGVLFTTDQLLLPGRRVEVSISWPAQLNNRCALRLVARGRVVRFDDGRAAMEIQQYEFKTQAVAPVIAIQ